MVAAGSSCQGSYDVFLSFRGKDTRNGFTAHLYKALCNKKIQTFMDADKMVKGEEISPSVVTAMDKSMFCIVVLSRNYASSKWCLEELVQILKRKNAEKQKVLPIFYNVNPSDVREQKGRFAKAFAKLEEKFKEEMERVQMWKRALTEVANISGWDARNRHEPTLIKEIIQYISDALINKSSKDSEPIVGVDSHLPVKERILVPNIPASPSIGERCEFPRKRKINQVKEMEIRESRSVRAMEVYSHLGIMEPDIATSLTIGQRSGVLRKRKIVKEKEISHTSHSSFLDLLPPPAGLDPSDLSLPPSSPPPFISPPTSHRPSPPASPDPFKLHLSLP